jgi:methionyl-tRNA formyltransferase
MAPKLTVEDARVDWAAPAMRVDRVVRACTPAPGAWTTFREERLKLRPVRLDPSGHERAPGLIDVGRDGVRVGTGSHPVLLGEVQPQGKRVMPASDWARGVRIVPGERLE